MEEPIGELSLVFKEAAADMQAGRFSEAAEKLDTLASVIQPHPDVFWNLGISRAQLRQHDRALTAWDAYRRVAREDWRGRAKVIQSCQALGDTARRDRERDELLALHHSRANPALAAEIRYCIEQLQVGERVVMAYEIFEPVGGHRVFYEFLVGRTNGHVEARYSLGSYDFTTEPARERGEIGPEERIYHLDRYDPVGHTTFAFYQALPSYDDVRTAVVEAITGAIAPRSGSSVSPDGTRHISVYDPQPIHLSGPDPDTIETSAKATFTERMAAWMRRAVRVDSSLN